MPDMQIAKVPVCLVVCVKDPAARGHWYDMLDSRDFRLQTKNIPELAELEIQKTRTLEEAALYLEQVFKRSPPWGGVLISDELIGPDADLDSDSDSGSWGSDTPNRCASSAAPSLATRFSAPSAAVALASGPLGNGSAPTGSGQLGQSPPSFPPTWQYPLRDLRDHFASQTYVSVALRCIPRRMPDVDLVIEPYPRPQDWLTGFHLLVKRLNYFIPPRKDALPPLPASSRIRPLDNYDEFCEALKLRRQVYEIMGYLEERFVATTSKLELCWHDSLSLHYGCFVPFRGREILAGTCRLILTKPQPGDVGDWCQRLRRTSGKLDRLVKDEQELMATFRLPIFHTMNLNHEMRAEGESEYPWAELSRVIVGPQWRGYGISSRLIEHALEHADRAVKVECSLLECLEIHQKMYEKYGFSVLGLRGEVAGVGKTMIGMRRFRPK
jgi:predicted GNAT family N-acyltransferase